MVALPRIEISLPASWGAWIADFADKYQAVDWVSMLALAMLDHHLYAVEDWVVLEDVGLSESLAVIF